MTNRKATTHHPSKVTRQQSRATQHSSPQAAQALPERLWRVCDVQEHERLRALAAQAEGGGCRSAAAAAAATTAKAPVLKQVRELAVPERYVLLLGRQRIDDVGKGGE